MTAATWGSLDIYDEGGGALLVAWGAFNGATGYNVYVNGAVAATVGAPALQTTLTGLTEASYSAGAVAPTPNNSVRPQNMPPVGVETLSGTYEIAVTAVVSGVERSATQTKTITLAPNNIMLTTPMRRPFPFPSTGPG